MNAPVKDVAELLALVAAAYVLATLVLRRVAHAHSLLGPRRLVLLIACTAFVVLAQVSEDVLDRESEALDRSLLLAVHTHVPTRLADGFSFLTATASAMVVVPAVAIAGCLMLWLRRGREALELVLTTAAAGAVVYVAKALVDRERPTLWQTDWYWGSSFPSGHTLTAAAIATWICLHAARARPATRWMLIALAVSWATGVGLSRLVLGVHWPTDVAAAACAGLLVALVVHAGIAIARRASAAQAGCTP